MSCEHSAGYIQQKQGGKLLLVQKALEDKLHEFYIQSS